MKKNIDFDKLHLLVLDVDGTMTDGGIYYDDNGNEIKKFCVKDAIGLKGAKFGGMDVLILTGRNSIALNRRMKELGIENCYEGIKNKRVFLDGYMKKNHISKEEVAYIGDDINDLFAMKMAKFIACPSDAVDEVLYIADYISNKQGGKGVIRDVVRYILKNKGLWDEFIAKMDV